MKQEQPNFMDSRTIAAVVMVGVVFMGWQWYMQKKYPGAFAKKPVSEAGVTPDGKPVDEKAANNGVQQVPAAAATPRPGETAAGPTATGTQPTTPTAEKLTHFQNEFLEFDISSNGMGLKNVKVRQYKSRKHETIQLGRVTGSSAALETGMIGRADSLVFAVEKVNENMFVGRAASGGVQVTKTIEIHPTNYSIEVKISASGSDDRFVGLTTALVEEVELPPSAGLFMPQFEKQEFFIETADTHDRVHVKKDDLTQSWSKVKIASIGSQFFTQALVDKSAVMPEGKARVDHAAKIARLELQYPVLNKGQNFDLQYTAFLGPKSYKLLTSANESLGKVVDFGFFHWLGYHILGLLNWFHALVGNWGIAIILLTIVVRLLVLPFNIYSYKSMRAMQVIQPKIQALRERYKDDQAKQQQEMMALMRTNKVNPLGGCLPVLLQFPIFIALYQVLGNSIELYQAPFGLWIHDLSLMDPFYILPVLMGVTMFIQQKITPNTMDPAQAKVLLFMPLIFTFFMASLPSGLTLYMWVGAVFSVLQQMYFLKASPLPVSQKK